MAHLGNAPVRTVPGMGGAAPDKAIASRFVVTRKLTPRPDGGGPLFRCGHCLAVVPDVRSNSALRCSACQRRNALPAGIWICCDRCGFEQRVRLPQLAAEPRCCSCGEILSAEDVPLTPLHRHRRRVRWPSTSHHAHHNQRREQATLTLFLFAAALLMSLKLLGQL